MDIETTVRDLAHGLGGMLGWSSAESEVAIRAAHLRHPAAKRNLVSTLASTAHLVALLKTMSDDTRRSWLAERVDGRSRLEQIRDGRLGVVAANLSDHLAGPFNVHWDGNWPSSRERLRERMPPHARAGEIVVGGDGGGVRIDIEVLVDPDGVVTGEHLPETWRDPPLEDVWLETYRRLEVLYPHEIPPPGGRRVVDGE